jgi:hypothetical protein
MGHNFFADLKQFFEGKKGKIIALLLLVVVLISFTSGYIYAQSTPTPIQTPSANVSTNSVTSNQWYSGLSNITDVLNYPVEVASYIIFMNGVTCCAKNGTTGVIDYSGTDAAAVINDALSNPDMSIYIASGTYNLNNTLMPSANDTLYGAGTSTILNFGNSTNMYGIMIDAPHCNVGNLYIIGDGMVYVDSNYATIHDITATVSYDPAFYVYANNQVLTNLNFINCNAINCSAYGFLVTGAGSPCVAENMNFLNCQAINSGRYFYNGTAETASNQINNWTTGFDLAEAPGLTIQNVLVQDCYASGSWESGFHIEAAPTKINVEEIGCTSENNGQKPGFAFGVGFMISSGVSLIACNSFNNSGNGFYATVTGSSPLTITNCNDNGSYTGLSLVNEGFGGTTYLSNDVFSNSQNQGVYIDANNVVINGMAIDDAGSYGISTGICNNITATNLDINYPGGTAGIDNYFYEVSNSNINLNTVGGSQPDVNFIYYNNNTVYSGTSTATTGGQIDLYVDGGTNVLLQQLTINVHGSTSTAIYCDSNPFNCIVRDTVIADESASPNLGYGIYGNVGSLIVDKPSITMYGVTTEYTHCRFTKNSGSQANGTATTFVIDPSLAGTPTGVWASFSTSAITGWTWVANATTITITIVGANLPASMTCYWDAIYQP